MREGCSLAGRAKACYGAGGTRLTMSQMLGAEGCRFCAFAKVK